jgi:uncharacterized protein YndB with AHSA1/START domain
MQTRRHVHEEHFSTTPEAMFALLHTPSAIREWWGAARAVTIPREGGWWVAAWGAREDDPDYIGAAKIRVFDPPRRLVLADYEYYAKTDPLPFQAEMTTEFRVIPSPPGAVLRVVQDGFPTAKEADEFYEACEVGWRATFAGIRRFLDSKNAPTERSAS